MTWIVISYCMIAVFVAAFIRGYSGFGFSLLAITSMSLVLAPALILPSIFMMEIVASVTLLPSIWKEVNWSSLRYLWIGCLIGTPLGVHFLTEMPVAPMKIALGIVVLCAVFTLYSGYARKSVPNTAETALTGGVLGLLNGAFGVVTPVVVFFFNSPAGAAVSRASLIAFFIGSDTIGLAFLAQKGLVTLDGFYRFMIFVPALVCGQWFGSRSFRLANPHDFRRIVLLFLAALAIATAIQGASQLVNGV